MIEQMILVYSKYEKDILQFMNIEETDDKIKCMKYCDTRISKLNAKLPTEIEDDDREKLEVLKGIFESLNRDLVKAGIGEDYIKIRLKN